jgi:hypothetical protein
MYKIDFNAISKLGQEGERSGGGGVGWGGWGYIEKPFGKFRLGSGTLQYNLGSLVPFAVKYSALWREKGGFSGGFLTLGPVFFLRLSWGADTYSQGQCEPWRNVHLWIVLVTIRSERCVHLHFLSLCHSIISTQPPGILRSHLIRGGGGMVNVLPFFYVCSPFKLDYDNLSPCTICTLELSFERPYRSAAKSTARLAWDDQEPVFGGVLVLQDDLAHGRWWLVPPPLQTAHLTPICWRGGGGFKKPRETGSWSSAAVRSSGE